MKTLLFILLSFYSLTIYSQKAEYKTAIKTNSIESLLEFLNEFPSSKYSTKVDDKLNEKLNNDAVKKSIKEYNNLLHKQEIELKKVEKVEGLNRIGIAGEYLKIMQTEVNVNKTEIVNNLFSEITDSNNDDFKQNAILGLKIIFQSIDFVKIKEIRTDEKANDLTVIYQKAFLTNQLDDVSNIVHISYDSIKENFILIKEENMNNATTISLCDYVMLKYFSD